MRKLQLAIVLLLLIQLSYGFLDVKKKVEKKEVQKKSKLVPKKIQKSHHNIQSHHKVKYGCEEKQEADVDSGSLYPRTSSGKLLQRCGRVTRRPSCGCKKVVFRPKCRRVVKRCKRVVKRCRKTSLKDLYNQNNYRQYHHDDFYKYHRRPNHHIQQEKHIKKNLVHQENDDHRVCHRMNRVTRGLVRHEKLLRDEEWYLNEALQRAICNKRRLAKLKRLYMNAEEEEREIRYRQQVLEKKKKMLIKIIKKTFLSLLKIIQLIQIFIKSQTIFKMQKKINFIKFTQNLLQFKQIQIIIQRYVQKLPKITYKMPKKTKMSQKKTKMPKKKTKMPKKKTKMRQKKI